MKMTLLVLAILNLWACSPQSTVNARESETSAVGTHDRVLFHLQAGSGMCLYVGNAVGPREGLDEKVLPAAERLFETTLPSDLVIESMSPQMKESFRQEAHRPGRYRVGDKDFSEFLDRVSALAKTYKRKAGVDYYCPWPWRTKMLENGSLVPVSGLIQFQ